MENQIIEQPVKQVKKHLPEVLKQFQFKPGKSGNPNGRPKGGTIKEYLQRKFRMMTDEEREEFISKVSPEFAWQMAEGRPSNYIEIEEESYNPYANLSREEIIAKIRETVDAYDAEQKNKSNVQKI